MMPCRTLVYAVIAVLAIAYPFIVYYGLKHYSVAVFAGLLFVLLVARVAIKGNYNEPSQWLQLVVIGAFCLVVAVINSESLLRYYPVLMSLGFSALFAFSLCSKTSLIERFVKMSGQEYSQQALCYMRRLTLVWAVFLAFNAMIATYTACCMSLKHWTLYNGLLAYFLLGGFALAELVFRYFYKKKYISE